MPPGTSGSLNYYREQMTKAQVSQCPLTPWRTWCRATRAAGQGACGLWSGPHVRAPPVLTLPLISSIFHRISHLSLPFTQHKGF